MQQMERVDNNTTYNGTLYPAGSYGFEVNWNTLEPISTRPPLSLLYFIYSKQRC